MTVGYQGPQGLQMDPQGLQMDPQGLQMDPQGLQMDPPVWIEPKATAFHRS